MNTKPSSSSFDESESDSDCVFLSESIEERDTANSEMDSDIEFMGEELPPARPPETAATVPSSKRKCKTILDYYGKENPHPTMHIQNFFDDIILQTYHVNPRVVTHGKQQMLLVLQIKIVVKPHFIMEKKNVDHKKRTALIIN